MRTPHSQTYHPILIKYTVNAAKYHTCFKLKSPPTMKVYLNIRVNSRLFVYWHFLNPSKTYKLVRWYLFSNLYWFFSCSATFSLNVELNSVMYLLIIIVMYKTILIWSVMFLISNFLVSNCIFLTLSECGWLNVLYLNRNKGLVAFFFSITSFTSENLQSEIWMSGKYVFKW